MAWLETDVTAQPAEEPISRDQAKAQCRVDAASTDSDSLIDALVKSARVYIESYCGIRLITQTLAMRCSSWADLARLPDAPLSAINAIQYVDTNGATQTLNPSVYSAMLYGLSPAVRVAYAQAWPTSLLDAPDAITVTATAGYGDDGATVPAPIVQAMLLMIGQWFDNRQDVLIGGRLDALPNASDALLANFRR
jgi:uncharacterized phiE125 gp8 family phage protein